MPQQIHEQITRYHGEGRDILFILIQQQLDGRGRRKRRRTVALACCACRYTEAT